MFTTVGFIFPIQGYTETITGSQNKELRYACKDGRPRKTSEYNEVLSQAKSNALRSWAAGKSVAISSLFSENEQQILTNIDDYFLSLLKDVNIDDSVVAVVPYRQHQTVFKNEAQAY